MRLLVTGVKGQLGSDIVKECEARGIEAVGVDIEEMDITDPQQVRQVISEGNFDGVIHCAAWTAVDAAEDPALYDKVEAVNGKGPAYITEVCRELDLPLMYFSTDYVFDGQGEEPWMEDAPRHPLNVYGKTKAMGEEAVESWPKHYIIRISWVFGLNGKNFIDTMLRLSESHDQLTVVNDQIGSVTYTKDLARLCVDMIQSGRYGTYHATNQGIISWADFAREIFRQAKRDVKVIDVSSDQYPTAAKRPCNSRMNQTRLDENGFKRLPDWKDALHRYLIETGVIAGEASDPAL